VRPIEEVGRDLGLREGELDPWGRGVAKLDAAAILDRAGARARSCRATGSTCT
jgi:formyltetrahydrofolate synthetase